MRPAALDEYPVHQAAVSMARVASSDKSFYDRCYFNAHDRTGGIFLVTGAGVYPNLGVHDAFATVRRGDDLWSVRISDRLEDRSLEHRVGPYRVEVIAPLRRLRVVCDAPEHGLAFDLNWEGAFPANLEQPHLMLSGPRTALDAQRFAQLGSWSGTLYVAGEDIAVDPDTWVGSRDRSWGIRPVGDPDPAGRAADEPVEGFWWLYVLLRFEDFSLIVIPQEDPDGYRTLNDAHRVFADGGVEQLGWPRAETDYLSKSRHPERARLRRTTPTGEPMLVEVETLSFVPLHVGSGYGGDPDWQHGQWRGRDWVSSVHHDLTDPDVQSRVQWGAVDHVARATCEGQTGWGLFELGNVGWHDPSGFADWTSVAP